MLRRWNCFVGLFAALAFSSAVMAQQQGGGTANTDRAAGSANTLQGAQGYGLNSRYMGSGFDIYMQGSSAMGSTTAGARAGSAGFGQGATSNFSGAGAGGGTTTGTSGTFGRAGGIGGIGGFGGLGGVGGLGGIGGIGGMGGMYGMGRNMFGGNSQQTGQTGPGTIRTRATLGFKARRIASPAVVNTYAKVIARVLDRGDYGRGQVNVTMEGQVAVLSGTVDSPHARDVAERLALLEPGIVEVRNELTVRVPEPTPATPPKPSSVGRPR